MATLKAKIHINELDSVSDPTHYVMAKDNDLSSSKKAAADSLYLEELKDVKEALVANGSLGSSTLGDYTEVDGDIKSVYGISVYDITDTNSKTHLKATHNGLGLDFITSQGSSSSTALSLYAAASRDGKDKIISSYNTATRNTKIYLETENFTVVGAGDPGTQIMLVERNPNSSAPKEWINNGLFIPVSTGVYFISVNGELSPKNDLRSETTMSNVILKELSSSNYWAICQGKNARAYGYDLENPITFSGSRIARLTISVSYWFQFIYDTQADTRNTIKPGMTISIIRLG